MRQKVVIQLFVLFCMSIACYAEEWIPPGFEHLVDGGRETSVVDVYYKGRLIAQTEAEFDDETIEFTNPFVVAYALPDSVMKKNDIAKGLMRKLDANTDLKCASSARFKKLRCQPRTDMVAVVLDRDRYAVTVYVGFEYLKDADRHTSSDVIYLTPSTNHLTYSSRFGSHVLGGRDNFIYSVRNYQVLSKGAMSIKMESIYNHNKYWTDNGTSEFYIYDFTGNYLKNRQHYALGLLSTPNSYFMPQERVVGVQLKNTNRLRQGGGGELGTPIEVEVAVPSVVSFYANGQMIKSSTYPVGVHFVDTSSFPAGSYNVEIIKEGIDGQVVKKSIAYLKNSSGVEPGYPEYNFTFGVNRGEGGEVFPKLDGDFISYMYYAFAYNNRLSLYLNAGYDESYQVSVGPGFYWRRHDYIRPTFAYDSKDGFLYSAAARTTVGSVNIGGSVTKTRNTVYDHGHMYNVFASYRHQRLGTLYTSYTVSNVVDFQAYLRKPLSLFLGLNKPLRVNAEVGTNMDHNYVRLALSQTVFSNKRHRGTLSSSLARDSGDDIYTGTKSGDYNANFELARDVKVSGGIRADEDSVSIDTNIGLSKEILGNQLSVSTAARNVSGGKTDYFYDVNLSRQDAVGFYITRDGIGFSRDMHSSTGAIVELKGEFNPKDLYIASGNEKVKFNANGVSSFVSIPPYLNYHLEVDSDSEQEYNIQPIREENELRLFPGNIAIVKFMVKPKYPLYANFHCHGAEYANKIIVSSIDTVKTDEYGFAVIDVLYDEDLTVLNDEGEPMSKVKFRTKGIKPSDGYAYIDKLTCRVRR